MMQRALDVKLVSSAERTQSLLFLKQRHEQRERAVKCSVYNSVLGRVWSFLSHFRPAVDGGASALVSAVLCVLGLVTQNVGRTNLGIPVELYHELYHGTHSFM